MDLPVVLLVDDIKLFLNVERGFLQEANVVVLTAENGQEALDRIQVRRPDLIFLGQRMPVMDGPARCAIIKKDPELKHIQVDMVRSSCSW
jgi:CheY-like chemotaxis protein